MNNIGKLFHDFQNTNPICIIGNLNVDLIIRNVPQLPNWGQEVLGTDQVLVSSGQAGIQKTGPIIQFAALDVCCKKYVSSYPILRRLGL